MDFRGAKAFPETTATVGDCYSYLDCDVLIVDRLVPSRLDSGLLSFAQDRLPDGSVMLLFEKYYSGTLAVRLPDDSDSAPGILIDGEEYSYAVSSHPDEPSYALISGPFEAGCRIRIEGAAPADTEAPEYEFCAELIPEGMKPDNGLLYYNNNKSRFIVRTDCAGATVTLTLPEGLSFDGTADVCSLGFKPDSSPFTGGSFTVYDRASGLCRGFDLTLVRSGLLDACGCAVNAYTDSIGAFSGEACYLIGSVTGCSETPTHNTRSDYNLGIDPLTGYKWGTILNRWIFELEDGNYRFSCTLTGGNTAITAYPGENRAKVLVQDAGPGEFSCMLRAVGGYLAFSFNGGIPESIAIRALDTTAEPSGYIPFGFELPEDETNSAPDLSEFDFGSPDPEEDEVFGLESDSSDPEDGEVLELESDSSDFEDGEVLELESDSSDPEDGEVLELESDSSDFEEDKVLELESDSSDPEDGEVLELESGAQAAPGIVSGPEPVPASVRPASASGSAKKHNGRPISASYGGSKQSAAKPADTALNVGIAAGAVAVIGSLIALFGRKKD